MKKASIGGLTVRGLGCSNELAESRTRPSKASVSLSLDAGTLLLGLGLSVSDFW